MNKSKAAEYIKLLKAKRFEYNSGKSDEINTNRKRLAIEIDMILEILRQEKIYESDFSEQEDTDSTQS